MNVEFLKSFSKDLDSLKSRPVKNALIRIIETLEKAESFNQVKHVKKLKGSRNAY